jgi:hypothetical protein
MGKARSFRSSRWLLVLLLSLLWATMGSGAALAERSGFQDRRIAANNGSRVRLNVFGEGEARGFLDVSTNARFANERPLTSGMASGSGDDILLRFSPTSGENTISETMRFAKPRTRITVRECAGGGQGGLAKGSVRGCCGDNASAVNQ